MILINRTGKQAYNINLKTQRFPDYRSKCKTNWLHLVVGRQSRGGSAAPGGTRSAAGPGPALPAVPWHSPAANPEPAPGDAWASTSAGSTSLRAAVSLRGRQRLPGVGDLGPPPAVPFSGPLARSQAIFQPESQWPKINSAIFTAASLYFSSGIPDAYVPTWAETGFVRLIWVQ